nr:hypothetical protein 3 [bacterium]
MDGVKDLSNLFGRVSALENDKSDPEATVSQIFKVYEYQGMRVTAKVNLHQYKLCSTTLTCGTGVII